MGGGGFCPGCIQETSLIPDDQLREFQVKGQRAVLARLDKHHYAAWGCDGTVKQLMARHEATETWRQIDPEAAEIELPSWKEFARRFRSDDSS